MTDPTPRTLVPNTDAPLNRSGMTIARAVSAVVMLVALFVPGIIAVEADISTAAQNSVLAVNSVAGVVSLVLGVLKKESVTPVADPRT